MNQTLEVLKTRRSCRKYLDKQVDETLLDQILEAGTWAPTGRGKQSPKIVVLQKKEDIEYLSSLNARILGNPDTDPFFGAPTVLVVFADREVSTYRHDGPLVMGNLMTAAHALGVASCYIFRAKEVFELPEGKELMKKWGISDNYEGIGNCLLGYEAEGGTRTPLPRKPDYIVKIK